VNDRREPDLHELSERAAHDEEPADPAAVGDAIVRRRWGIAIATRGPLVFSIASARAERLSDAALGAEGAR
jgi:hypothetical protein